MMQQNKNKINKKVADEEKNKIIKRQEKNGKWKLRKNS